MSLFTVRSTEFTAFIAFNVNISREGIRLDSAGDVVCMCVQKKERRGNE